jgi:hypothetical protein
MITTVDNAFGTSVRGLNLLITTSTARPGLLSYPPIEQIDRGHLGQKYTFSFQDSAAQTYCDVVLPKSVVRDIGKEMKTGVFSLQ